MNASFYIVRLEWIRVTIHNFLNNKITMESQGYFLIFPLSFSSNVWQISLNRINKKNTTKINHFLDDDPSRPGQNCDSL